MHLFTMEALWECFDELDRNKAIGIDGVSKAQYGQELIPNLEGLVVKLKQMAYRPGPVRQVLIDKEGKPGAKRPLGISNFEDKIVQKMMQRVLESVYEPIFLDCSYGFRPGRGCHDAVKALRNHLCRNEVETVIDVDLANFFGTIDHALLEQILRKKIKDKRLMRYILRMFKAGMLAAGELQVSEEGVPQGSICSPVLANIFAHYVIDQWFQEVVKQHCEGSVELFRYADDAVICCRYERDAQRIRKALGKRLGKYHLTLNEEKTHMVSFSKRGYRRGDKQGAFDFLGFTYYLSRTRRGYAVPKLKTSGKRLCSKLKRVNQWARAMRHRYPLRVLWRRFSLKLAGHTRYYGVSYNWGRINQFYHAATQILFRWLNRRGHRRSYDWDSFSMFRDQNPLPPIRIYHRLY